MKQSFLKITIVFLLLISTHKAFAARLYFDVADPAFGPHQDVTLPLMLDTGGESINAVDIHIDISPSLTYKDVYDGQSFITTWIDSPSVTDNVLSFSGIIPGGFDGVIDPFKGEAKNPGIVGYFTFTTGNEGNGTITLAPDTRAYINDGAGTETFVLFTPLTFSIQEGKNFISPSMEDKTPPAEFTITLSQDPDSYAGKYFIIFEAKDKESGIDHYEVKEGSSDFVTASSPYVLKQQNLGVPIVVKAVDKSGNTRLATISPDAKSGEQRSVWPAVMLGATVLLILVVITHKKARKKKHEQY